MRACDTVWTCIARLWIRADVMVGDGSAVPQRSVYFEEEFVEVQRFGEVATRAGHPQSGDLSWRRIGADHEDGDVGGS